LIGAYKRGDVSHMTPELWQAKQVVDSTLHPDTGEPVFLPLRMSCFVLSNLVVTAGMLTPGMGVRVSFPLALQTRALEQQLTNLRRMPAPWPGR
jgi:sideroflexin-5